MSEKKTTQERRAAQPERAKILLADINRHLGKLPMGRAYFSVKAAGHTRFIRRLEDGYGCGHAVEERVRKFMQARATKGSASKPNEAA